MKSYYHALLSLFDDERFYIRKKGEYTLLILIFVYLYASLMFLIDLVLNGDYIVIGIQFVAVTVLMGLFLSFWKKKRIELAANLTVLLGFGFAIYLFREPVALRFYMQLLVIMLIVIAGYVKRYQFVATYTILGILLLVQFYNVNHLSYQGNLYSVPWADMLYTIMGIIILIICFEFLKRISERELHAADELNQMMEQDDLTGLPNRRKFNRIINAYIGKSEISFLLLDIDHFKDVNDTYGHQHGDEILEMFSKVLSALIRPTDIAFRWGGEEFVILLIGTDYFSGTLTAERIRKEIEHYNFRIEKAMTVSIGLVQIPIAEDSKNLSMYFKRADRFLYHAKQEGRNRICHSEDKI
jgi:diguanylate cyclase (GGDEF)-like protein